MTYFAIICGFLLIIAILLFEIRIISNRVAKGSVIFKKCWITNFKNKTAKTLCITHSKIPGSPVDLFSENLYSHWTLGIWDNEDDFYIVSPTGSNSVVVINPSKPIRLDEKRMMFYDADRFVYIIKNNEIWKPCYKLSLIDIINDAWKLNKMVKYNVFGLNCHFQIKQLINMYCDVSINDEVNKWKMFKNTYSETFGNDYSAKFFKGKLPRKYFKHFRTVTH